jgi:hypothetical protein
MKQLLMLLIMSIVFIGISCEEDPVECKSECTDNATTSCKDAKTMQTCTLQDNGCNIWVPIECTGTNTCVAQNDSVASCTEEIAIEVCTDGGNECAANTNGKTDCVADLCVEPAATGCTKDDQRCNNDDVETCKADGTWEVTTDCTGTEKCDASTFTCEEPSVGCSADADCDLSEICSTNTCVAIAEGDTCTENAKTRCEDAETLLVCTLQADMSYAWESTDCSATSCVTDPSSEVDGCQLVK